MDQSGQPQAPSRSNLLPPQSNADQPSSPLERLDPQRLRDQAVALHIGSTMQGISPDTRWSPLGSSVNVNINSPTRNIQSPMAINHQIQSGSVDSLQRFSNQPFFSTSNDVNYGIASGQEFSKSQLQSPSIAGNVPVQLGSPSIVPQSPFIARTPNPTAQSPIPPNPRQMLPYSGMLINNGQPNYRQQTPTTPGTSGTSQRLPYSIGQTGPFNYPPNQQPPQQWPNVTLQQQQQHFGPRMTQQPIPQTAVHRFNSSYNGQNGSQSSHSYGAIPGSPTTRIAGVRQPYSQVVTSQSQQISTPLTQQAIQPQTPQTPNPHTPVIPTVQSAGSVAQSTGFYPPSGYPSNYQQSNQQAYQQQPQTSQPTQIRPFVAGTNATQDPALYMQLPAVVTAQTGGKTIVPSIQRPQVPMPAVFAQDSRGLRSPSIASLNQPLYLHPQQQHSSVAMTQRGIISVPNRPQMQSANPPDPRAHIPAQICLAGCHFLISDQNSGHPDLKNIVTMIKYYGGIVETSFKCKKADEKKELAKFTHYITESICGSRVNRFLEKPDGRICTLRWLNDVIERRHVEPPFKVCHLPAFPLHRNATVTNKVISVAGFTKKEAACLKWMAERIYAKFSPYLMKDTTFLIAKNTACLKVEKYKNIHANIHLINALWLFELYMGNTKCLSDIRTPRYSVSQSVPIDLGAKGILKLNENCMRLMVPWQHPLGATDEVLRHAEEIRKSVIFDETMNATIKYSFNRILENGPTPTQDQINTAVAFLERENKRPKMAVFFTGLSTKKVEIMRSKIQVLGVRVVERVEDCTVVIAPFLVRSIAILKALALGKELISPVWVLNSYTQLRLLPLEDFFLFDNANELEFNCNPRATILMAKKQRIFDNICFYVSPSVRPSRRELREIIECGGGAIDDKKPVRYTIYKAIEEDRPYIIIAHVCDLPFFRKLTDCNIPIFSEEFIFCAIMRYKIDTTNIFAINLKKEEAKAGITTNGVQNLKQILNKQAPIQP